MQNTQKIVLAAALIITLAGVAYFSMSPQVATEADLQQVAARVEEFGKRLSFVSLAAEPAEILSALDEHYADLVSKDLLDAWKKDPSKAPGRFASSPWPDRIAVSETIANEDGTITVHGSLIELTSDPESPPQAYVITALLKKYFGNWLITEFSGGPARN